LQFPGEASARCAGTVAAMRNGVTVLELAVVLALAGITEFEAERSEQETEFQPKVS